MPGVLIIRIRENLDFGTSLQLLFAVSIFRLCVCHYIANTAQLKGLSCRRWPGLSLYVGTERLRRLELYGTKKSHPSEDPRRQEASVMVFHLADVETIDAS